MAYIPGLSLCSVDSDRGIPIPSFTGTITVPESHKFGNCRPVSDFEKLSIIADGKFGTTYKSRDKRTGEIFALKKFKMPDDDSDGFPTWIIREVNILYILNHENIIKRHGQLAGENLEDNYLLLDYCVLSLRDLFEQNIQAIFDRAVVKCIMKQLFDGLEYIHVNLIIHRDINCSNILFNSNGVLKITGFRTARFHSPGSMTPELTELTYRAPELLFQSHSYYATVDLWSCGCVFAKLLLRKPLFTGNSELEVLTSIIKILGVPTEDIWPGFTEIFKNFDNGLKKIEGNMYCELKEMFSQHPKSVQDLILGFIKYNPVSRLKLNDALYTNSYFKESPHACSLPQLASIICVSRKNPEQPMDITNESSGVK